MSDAQAAADAKPLKTWSHLQKARKRPNEYSIVSTNLHFSTDVPECSLGAGSGAAGQCVVSGTSRRVAARPP